MNEGVRYTGIIEGIDDLGERCFLFVPTVSDEYYVYFSSSDNEAMYGIFDSSLNSMAFNSVEYGPISVYLNAGEE